MNKNETPRLQTAIVPSVELSKQSPRQVSQEFLTLLNDNGHLQITGSARKIPARKQAALLFEKGLKPRAKVEIFDTRYYLTGIRQIPELRFVVGYIVQPRRSGFTVSARIIYKDLSLVWRTASHHTFVDNAIWIGKGDTRSKFIDDDEYISSDESTTDVPLEILTALESLSANVRRAPSGHAAIDLLLQRARGDRIHPFRDFTKPRELARANPRNLINGGKSIARFTRHNDPSSLKITRGFEPDFADGIIERSVSTSSMYGGELQRFRILSSNRKIQYFFIAGPDHVWIIPPQSVTTELSSFGVRTIDVLADDDLFIPGYEYYFYEDSADGPRLHSQIPEGFVGEICPSHEDKADASPWLEKIPVIREFRKQVLG